ncbi:hypothetical protein JCM8547_006375 [Rhodosporidiobolus lusitaniae]
MVLILENLVLAALLLACFAYKHFVLDKKTPVEPEKTVVAAPSNPEEYRFPAIEPLERYDAKALEETKPMPYRPFRWGPTYPQHMGIRNIQNASNWLQLDNLYSDVLSVRTRRTLTPSYTSTRTLPGFHSHALEALVEIASFLSTRYPALFSVTRTPYVDGKEETYGDSIVGKEGGAVVAVENKVTGEKWDFMKIEEREGREWNPMAVAGLLLQDDLAVMVEDEQGHYRFQAGSICTAGFWRLKDKIGLTLDDIHFKGSVPNYAQKYQKSMNRFFTNLREDKLVERNNYFFQVDRGLDWSTKTNGTEAIFDHYDKGPVEKDFATTPGAEKPVKADDVRQVCFRTERQSLRRLPRTRAVLFTIRTYLIPVTDLADEPGVPGRMASGIRSWPQGERSVDWYKGAELYNPVLLPYLDQKHAEQVASGKVELNEKGTMDEQYPF